MANRIQVRRGTSTQWSNADPVLAEGEIGFNSTLGSFKIGDGTTVWSELDYYQTTENITPAEVGAIALTEKGAANGVAELDADKNVITASKIVFEGATADAYETYIQVGAEPATADVTFTLPTTSGTFALTSDISGYALLSGATFTGAVSGTDLTLSGNLTVNGTTTTIDTQNLLVEDKNIIIGNVTSPTDAGADGGGITLKGTTDKTFNWVDATDSWTSSENLNVLSGKTIKINGTDVLTSTQVLGKSVPTGDIVGTSDSQTLTNKTISGSNNTISNIGNSSLTNSSITINGTPVSLGGSITIAGDIEGVTAGTGLSGGGTSGTVTLSIDTAVVATTNNTLTMTNKTLTSPTITTPTVSGLYLSDNNIVIEGTNDVNETTLTFTDPTADRTITFPNADGTVVLTTNNLSVFASTTSSQLAGIISDETGSGSLVFATSPTLVTPNIGVATGTSFNSITALSSTTPSANGAAAVGTSTTVARADHVHPTTGLGLTSGTLAQFASTTSSQLAGVISDETGSGSLVFATSPTLTTPNLGTPSSLTLTNATGLPIAGLVASTTTAIGVGSIELGSSTDTTISRSSAGVIAVEGVVVPTISSSNTLTNKTINGANNTLTVRLANDVSGTLAVANGGTGITSFGTGVATFLGTPSSSNLAAAITDETGSGSLVFGTSPTIATPTLTLSTTTSTTEGRIAWDSTNDKIIIGDGTTAREFASSTLITNAQTGTSYTLVLADKDKLVELSNASAITLNIPTNSVAYPVGTQINILQTGAGQVTIAAGTPATTTVNGTPGLKLRAQWSSATLIKRATETWVAIGDLSA